MKPKPDSLHDLRAQLADIVKLIEKQVPYAAGLGLKREGVRLSVSSTQEQVYPEPANLGVVLTVFNGETFFERASNQFDAKSLKEMALTLAKEAVAARKPGSQWELDPGISMEQDFSLPCKAPGSSVSLEDKLKHARTLQAAAAAAGKKVVNAIAVVGDLESDEVFVNRARNLRQKLYRYDEVAQVIVSDGQRTQMLWDGESLAGGWEHQGIIKPRLIDLVKDAEALLKAKRLEPGTYEIVADQEWAGILAHEAFGHGTETDMYLKDRAMGQAYTGKRVASDITRLADDPTHPGQAATFFFDHEGASASRSLIIEDGVLKRGMTDFYSATLLGLPRSANGRRESWERKAYARMTNTFFMAGKSKPADMIKSLKDGIYLRYPSNGMEDPQGWGIQCEGLWAQRVKDGKLTDEIYSPVIMTGFVPDILQSISMVGDDLKITGLGYCGKGHKEIVKNTMGGPHLKFKARLA